MNQLDSTVEELDRTSKPKENSSLGCLDFPSTFIGSLFSCLGFCHVWLGYLRNATKDVIHIKSQVQLMKEERKQGQFFALDHLLCEHWQIGNKMLSQLWQWFSSRINANHNMATYKCRWWCWVLLLSINEEQQLIMVIMWHVMHKLHIHSIHFLATA